MRLARPRWHFSAISSCPAAVRASEAQSAHCRSLDLRLALSAAPLLLEPAIVFKPEALVRWHRSGFRLYWRWKSRPPYRPPCGSGRHPRFDPDNQPRQPELLKLGVDIAQSTVAKYMSRRHGPRSPGWRVFLRNHTAHIAGVDLFVVPTIGFKLLYGLVILRLERRRLVWTNVTANPTAEWIARQITEAFPWDEAPKLFRIIDGNGSGRLRTRSGSRAHHLTINPTVVYHRSDLEFVLWVHHDY